MSDVERAFDALLSESHLAAPYQLPTLFARYAERLGVTGAVVYLADLQQNVLVPFLPPGGASRDESVVSLGIDSTLAGRAYQHVEMAIQEMSAGRLRIWLPLVDGSDRLGVMAVVGPDQKSLDARDGLLAARLRRFAAIAAELIMSKTLYGDTIVRVRRSADMGLAAEMQWSLLPPLTFACQEVTVAAALEPAYRVAGDTVDYAVDAGRARIGVFDGMGHGLHSAQCASLTVATYRNARR
ncbi:MAG: hypothetical protein QOC80_1273, partial [Frankiaceae bacterium]|nr:hypothetical protein [Frankiaceae bacterium]